MSFGRLSITAARFLGFFTPVLCDEIAGIGALNTAALCLLLRQSFDASVFTTKIAGMEGAVWTFGTASAKIGDLHLAVSLFFNIFQDARNRQPRVGRRQRTASEVADGLNMDTADIWCMLQGELENLAQRMVIDTWSNRRNQNNRKSGFAAAADCEQFGIFQGTAAQCLVHSIVQTIELKEYTGNTDLSEMSSVSLFFGNADTVCIQLKKGKAFLAAECDHCV